MAHDWLHDYTLLVLRLGRLIAERANDDSLLDYYGPPEWQARVAREPMPSPVRLVRDANLLGDRLPDQGFEAHRAAYLARNLRALETVSRRLSGEPFSLREEALRCFDLHVDTLPETLFEQAHSLYDEALPGDGTLAERLQRWRTHYELPPEKTDVLSGMIQRAVNEARRRTGELIELPADEEMTVEPVSNYPVRAMAYYLGGHRSRILINPTYPFNLADLLYVVCHEGYPGHLAEIVLKEEHLIHRRGYVEQQVTFLLTPPFVISEGLALLAHELIFPPGSAMAWLAAHIYPEAGIVPDGSDLTKIHRATDLLLGVWCNAALLLDEGHPTDEVRRYLMRFALMDEAGTHRALQSLQRPYCEAYIFTYFYGRQLLDPLLQGPQQRETLRRLLTEQSYPSELTGAGFTVRAQS